jgi:hypothetical protein
MTKNDPAQEAKQARKSALVVGLVLLAIAAWNVWKGRPPVYFTAGGIGLVLLVISFTWAAAALVFHRNWMRFAEALGYVNSRIILGITFFFLITPYSLIMRLFGRNILGRRGPKQDTYWIPRKKPHQEPQQFERLF